MATGVLTLSAVLLPTSAYASDNDSQSEAISFGYWDSSSFSEVFTSVTETNSPEAAASLFNAAHAEPSLLPSLEGLSASDRTTVLNAAVSAASSERTLPSNIVALADDGWGLESRIIGQPIANGFAWQHKDRYNLEICPSGPSSCDVNDWMDFTYTVDPGGVGTRLTVSTLTWGSHLTGHRTDTQVFRSGDMIKIKDGPERSGDGTYQVMLSPHLSLTGYWFAAAMSTQVYNNISMPIVQYAFRTNASLTCTEPTPGAWRCKFPD